MTISFLASHGGSAAKQIIEAINQNVINGKVGVIITNNSQSDIFSWCKTNDFPIFHISGKTHLEGEDQVIMERLVEFETDLVILSGYMKKVESQTRAQFSGRIFNIHPSLLPKHGGQGMYGDYVHQSVLQAGDKISGASVHIINEEYDEGAVLLQKEVPVLEDDTVDSLKARVQSIEGSLYIDAIKKNYPY